MNSTLGDLILLLYTPREDAEQRGYARFLIDEDNPFFNSIPGIREYTNWQVISLANCAVPFTHFDLLYLDSAEVFQTVWDNPDLQNFSAKWIEVWGRFPDIEPERMDMNFTAYRCAHVGGPEHKRQPLVAFMPSRHVTAPTQDATIYQITETLLGDIRFSHFALVPMERREAFSQIRQMAKPPFFGAALGEVIAAPR